MTPDQANPSSQTGHLSWSRQTPGQLNLSQQTPNKPTGQCRASQCNAGSAVESRDSPRSGGNSGGLSEEKPRIATERNLDGLTEVGKGSSSICDSGSDGAKRLSPPPELNSGSCTEKRPSLASQCSSGSSQEDRQSPTSQCNSGSSIEERQSPASHPNSGSSVEERQSPISQCNSGSSEEDRRSPISQCNSGSSIEERQSPTSHCNSASSVKERHRPTSLCNSGNSEDESHGFNSRSISDSSQYSEQDKTSTHDPCSCGPSILESASNEEETPSEEVGKVNEPVDKELVDQLLRCEEAHSFYLPVQLDFAVDKDGDVMKSLCRLSDKIVCKLVNWMKEMPFYGDITPTVHTQILTNKWHELLLLETSAKQSFLATDGLARERPCPHLLTSESERNLTILHRYMKSSLPEEMKVDLEELRAEMGMMMELHTQVIANFRRLALTKEEFVCLKVILLLNQGQLLIVIIIIIINPCDAESDFALGTISQKIFDDYI